MTVQAYNPSGFPVTATTDPQGRYFIPVPVGTYRLVAYDNSGTYAVSFYPNAPSFEQSQQINVTEGQVVTVNFTLPAGQKISGRVSNAASGGALQGAVVAAYNLDGSRRTFVTTGADGSYTLTVPNGSYKIVAYHDVTPFIPLFYSNQQLFEQATVVTPPASNVNFGLAQGVKVSGNVKEKISGRALAGLSVVAYDLQGRVQFRTETNPSGDFAFVLPLNVLFKFGVEDPGGNFATTFYRDASTFASAATINANFDAPLLNFTVGRVTTAPLTTIYVPGVISAQNASGTVFKTDVWIQNPNNESIVVKATFLPAGQDNSAATGLDLSIPARGQLYARDLIATVFGTTGAGALRLESPAVFRATSRTYNVPPDAAITGTFGLSIPGQSLGDSLSRATLAGLAQNTEARTNIGIMNPHAVPIEVRVDVFSATGSLIGTQTFPLRPGEWAQPAVAAFAPGPYDDAYAVLSSQEASFFSYAAVVDNKSNDGTIILPSAD
ncbi:MAG TPA: carboxypeptidase-like regulatory domain-containing protein, partial [Thermoanaerobaculia bacterium]